jgi:glutathione peroxidase
MALHDVALHDIALTMLDDRETTLGELAGRAVLLVNVASKCGLTPQYEGLQRLAEKYGDRGLTVLGVPCNQFAGQEPGSPLEIATFCATTYGVTFPLTAKTDVNGADRHPLFAELTAFADGERYTGDVRWNFEKWLISPDGEILARFAPPTEPEDPTVVAAIEATLPA